MAAESQVKSPHRSSSHVLQAKRSEEGWRKYFQKYSGVFEKTKKWPEEKESRWKSGAIEGTEEVKRAHSAEECLDFSPVL